MSEPLVGINCIWSSPLISLDRRIKIKTNKEHARNIGSIKFLVIASCPFHNGISRNYNILVVILFACHWIVVSEAISLRIHHQHDFVCMENFIILIGWIQCSIPYIVILWTLCIIIVVYVVIVRACGQFVHFVTSYNYVTISSLIRLCCLRIRGNICAAFIDILYKEIGVINSCSLWIFVLLEVSSDDILLGIS